MDLETGAGGPTYWVNDMDVLFGNIRKMSDNVYKIYLQFGPPVPPKTKSV